MTHNQQAKKLIAEQHAEANLMCDLALISLHEASMEHLSDLLDALEKEVFKRLEADLPYDAKPCPECGIVMKEELKQYPEYRYAVVDKYRCDNCETYTPV